MKQAMCIHQIELTEDDKILIRETWKEAAKSRGPSGAGIVPEVGTVSQLILTFATANDSPAIRFALLFW